MTQPDEPAFSRHLRDRRAVDVEVFERRPRPLGLETQHHLVDGTLASSRAPVLPFLGRPGRPVLCLTSSSRGTTGSR
ncbi:MAG: hypothetical protein AAFV53_00885 [Myxococcota bacterium]